MAGHTQRQWEGKFFRCGMRCHYCLVPLVLYKTLDSEQQATKDHLTPISRGGRNTIDNIVPACLKCNQRKAAMTEKEFRQTFSKAFEILSCVPALSGEMSLEARDEPSLAALRRENESVSWAWRNPA